MNLAFPKTSEPNLGSEVFLQKPFRSRLLLFAIFLLAAGCSRDASIPGSAPFYAGTFEASCSPVDGLAFVFDLYRLGDPDPPPVSISIWRFDGPIVGKQFDPEGPSAYPPPFTRRTEWLPTSECAI